MSDATEEWRPIPEWESWYEVSDLGRVRRITSGHILRQFLLGDRQKYPAVHLSRPGRKKGAVVHRLVLHAFRGAPPSPSHEGGHRNGNRFDNTLSNLEWITHQENEADRARHGTVLKGERHSQAKLTEADVIEMRRLHHEEGVSCRQIAFRFGVHPCTGHRVVTGRGWKEVA